MYATSLGSESEKQESRGIIPKLTKVKPSFEYYLNMLTILWNKFYNADILVAARLFLKKD